mmetsp:Transcript_12651/g.26831  ORF Transcript_12651/g.26831 Transcript_12651/m.26831 type:complete len:443 (+) Transcript_12651:138-1466(+)|eukprot:CAMPEP_0201123758 /NCGR_PEP_ID=MMETSP0850-20130426/9072_1 /ASSEMBLY_ACC=CAM_ASM_000622 /TAXON_ID=183588 /ORGANISM="Pseudo-nitzschia fraudulenta, Strain WWA7" /LENGTH=442 /DNA_ID=CAMNT_0047390827 /DNA_START=64 /DNA_END=1392 /DNA_ORIENTATION=+
MSESKCPFAAAFSKAATSYPDAAKANKDGIVTNLTNKRSSEGMGLPEALSQTTIDTIVATAPAVAPKMLDITKCFYTKVLGKHPELKQFFNTAHNVPISDHQPKALAASCIAYATNITDLTPLLVAGGPVAAICHRHVALAIHPMQYVVVHENLMEAIGDILGDIVTPEIGAAWSEAVLFLAKAMIDTEESLYKMVEQREGGWSGFAEFEVSEINALTDTVKQVSFKPPSGSPLEGKNFAFTAGQYLSIQIDMEGDGLSAPRHYTATGPVGADYLQCTIKKQKQGKCSTYVHENLKVGDKVTLATPMGVFTAPETTPDSAVLMSAGIGVTPMVNLQRSMGDAVKLVVHVDRKPETHPYKEFFAEKDNTKLYKYTRVDGRPTAEDLVAETIEAAGTDNEFFICGPEKWMDDVQQELLAKGAKKVVCEVFGSQLATGCPFFQSS